MENGSRVGGGGRATGTDAPRWLGCVSLLRSLSLLVSSLVTHARGLDQPHACAYFGARGITMANVPAPNGSGSHIVISLGVSVGAGFGVATGAGW